MNPTPCLLRADAIFHRGAAPEELRGVSLEIEAGRFTFLSGPPGSGAGLLLRLLGLLERPGAGEVRFEARATAGLDEAARTELRNRAFGFVFAEPFLLDSFTVAENVAMPLFRISDLDIEHARLRTARVLEFAGLSAAGDLPAAELSMLDQYKLAVARALAVSPRVLVAEDAGLHLGAREFPAFAGLLRAAPDALGVAVLATSPAGAEIFSPDREVRLERGLIAADSHPVSIASREAPAHD